MANVLNMAKKESILSLHAQGWSQRRIARELGIDRGTVSRTLQSISPEPKAASAPTGSESSNAATFSGSPGFDSKTATHLAVPTGEHEARAPNPEKSSQLINVIRRFKSSHLSAR